MSVPGWYVLVLLSLAAFRTWRLLAEDDILERPRRYVTRTPSTWREGDPSPSTVRFGVAEFIECPWCLGFWVTLGWWAAWEIWPFEVEVAAVPMALSALVPIAYRLSSQS